MTRGTSATGSEKSRREREGARARRDGVGKRRSDSGVPRSGLGRGCDGTSQSVAARPQARVAAMSRHRREPVAMEAASAVLVSLVRVLAVSYVLLWPVLSEETSLTGRMRTISEDLDRQLNEIMASQALVYSTVNTVGLPYNATTKFNPKGMGQLYNVTNTFIDLVQSKQAYPEGEYSCPFRLARDLVPHAVDAFRRGGFWGLGHDTARRAFSPC